MVLVGSKCLVLGKIEAWVVMASYNEIRSQGSARISLSPESCLDTAYLACSFIGLSFSFPVAPVHTWLQWL